MIRPIVELSDDWLKAVGADGAPKVQPRAASPGCVHHAFISDHLDSEDVEFVHHAHRSAAGGSRSFDLVCHVSGCDLGRGSRVANERLMHMPSVRSAPAAPDAWPRRRGRTARIGLDRGPGPGGARSLAARNGSLVSSRPVRRLLTRRQGRIRLEAQDTALSRRRSPVRIRYAVPVELSRRPRTAPRGRYSVPARRPGGFCMVVSGTEPPHASVTSASVGHPRR